MGYHNVFNKSACKAIGDEAEQQACDYLLQQGLQLVLRNYLCRVGEIDVIMRDKNYLVFIEVRYRQRSIFGHAIETVNWHKQQKLIKTAKYYLISHRVSPQLNYRFDVVALTGRTAEVADADIAWIRNAFQL